MILETGAGGATYESWYKLQPILAQHTRVCSYDRAGFGFSQLGTDLPRDLNHDLDDLHGMLQISHERGPYVLVGHSMGGLLVGAYADKFTSEVDGLVLLEAAVILSADEVNKSDSPKDPALEQSLAKYKNCESRMATAHGVSHLAPHDDCLDSIYFSSLPAPMAAIEAKHEASPDYWRAVRSELENNWRAIDSREAAALMTHRWQSISVRVVTAALSTVDDAELAKATGIALGDKVTLESVRSNHSRWEGRQRKACEFSQDCKVTLIHTANHFIQNAAPDEVAKAVETILDAEREPRNEVGVGSGSIVVRV